MARGSAGLVERMGTDGTARPVVVEWILTARGELALRRHEEHYEIISNGVFLMDTRYDESARLLVRAPLAGRQGPIELLLGGLGVGFSLTEALEHPAVHHVTVVEVEPAVVGWHDTYLRELSAGAVHDPRVSVVCADLLEWLPRTTERFDVICLDVDNGPNWTVTDGNASLYGDEGLALLEARLAPGGSLAVWSAGADPAFEARLRGRFDAVRVLPVEVARGEPDLVYLARDRPLPSG